MKKAEKKASSPVKLTMANLQEVLGQESKVIQVTLAKIDTALSLGPR